MKTHDRLPDFLIIGAGKSGTTALFYFLSQHPNIFIPRHKEPNFFALEGVSLQSYDLEESRQYHLRSIDDYDSYVNLFKDALESQLVGENSNMYLTSEKAIANIKKYTPDAKLIAIIRNPADRLISRYTHLVREDSVPEGGIEAVFDKSSIWWKRPDLVQEGFYGAYLSRYFEEFDQDQVKVILYDEFRADGNSVLRDVCEFLGVSTEFDVDSDMILNKSGRLKDNFFNKVLGQNGTLIRSSKKAFPHLHKKLKKNDFIKKVLVGWRNQNLEDVEVPANLRQRIVDEIYKEDILKLEKVLGKSLKSWYAPITVNE